MNLIDLMFQHGWKALAEGDDGLLFVRQVGSTTRMEIMRGLLALAGYETSANHPKDGNYLFVYTNPREP